MENILKMKSLVEITKIVTESDDFYKIKDIIISKMLDVVHPTKACVNLFYGNDYNYAHLVCSATLDYIPKLFPAAKNEYGTKVSFDLYPAYIRESVLEKKIVIVKNLFEDKRAAGEEEMAINEGYIGRAVFPFIINNKTVGFMTCYLTKDDYLSQNDIDFISQVASLMSLSITITEKNNGIKSLIEKLRNSIKNINKATRHLYSSKDMYYYLKKMSLVVSETTHSRYSLINIYNMDEKGNVVGQKLSVSYPDNLVNELNSIMSRVNKQKKVSGYKNNIGITLPGGETVDNQIYYKFILDPKTMLVITCLGDKKYTDDDESTISALTKQIALSIQNYEYSNSSEIHKEIDNELLILKKQQKLIMNEVSVQKFYSREMFFYHEAAKVVGGDFYHAINVGEKLYFIVADVMGHGITSNYIVALLKGAFEILARYAHSPKEILRHLNENLFAELDNMGIYTTAVVGEFDMDSTELILSNAGHYFPIIINEDKSIMEFNSKMSSLPLGILETVEYKDIDVDLKNMKQICFFTDGVVEMKNPGGEEFGVENLKEFLLNNIDNDKKVILENLRNKISSYDITEDQKDDILLVFVK